VEHAGGEIEGLHVANVQPRVIEADLNSLSYGLEAVDTSRSPLSLNLLENLVSFKTEVTASRVIFR
jgi:hypothetical protein